MPTITDVAAYGTVWKAWWVELQPAWRGKTWPLPRKSGDWTDLRRGGKNGLFIAILALAWWYAEAAEAGNVTDVNAVVSEVTYALSEMYDGPGGEKCDVPSDSGGEKRDMPSDSGDNSRPTKRRRRR